ncbi:MAG: hypothetical protein C0440_02085 [Candidatus Pelagibacter sp.]|nr:hypothetical protein [Candidatus Pelagibacter sp.]
MSREYGFQTYKLIYKTKLANSVEIVSDMGTFCLINQKVKNGQRVLLTSHEPSPYSPDLHSIQRKKHLYSLILHSSKAVCENNNYQHHLGGFLFNNYFGGFTRFSPEKEFAVSHLCSFSYGAASNNPYKLHTNVSLNYLMRKELIDRKTEIHTPGLKLAFFVSNRPNIPDEYRALKIPTNIGKAEALYSSQFHIVIENCCEIDYFSEKIIEPILNKSIPIYIGCPNIGEYFDKRGMFIANNVDDLIRIINNLTPETYQKMSQYIEINYQKALKMKNENQLIKTIKSQYSTNSEQSNHLILITKFSGHLKMLAHILSADASFDFIEFIDNFNKILQNHNFK